MKTLYLHIGTPKTGTTAIQVFCQNNQELLQEKGYDYPIFKFSHRGVDKRRNGHFLVNYHSLGNDQFDVEREQTEIQEGFRQVLESFEKYDNVILSDENIWHGTRSDRRFPRWQILKDFVDANGIELRVIVYIRRQDKLITSWLNQQIQDGWPKISRTKWEDFIKAPTIIVDYYAHLERIAAVIGKENIIVRVFERDKFEGGNIENDFLKICGLAMTDEYKVEQEFQNQSQSYNVCEIKRVMNTLPGFNHSNFVYTKTLTEQCGKSGYVSDWFSKEERIAFLERCEESNQKIAREYLHQEDGSLFFTAIEDTPKWEANNPYMNEDMVKFFGNAYYQQLDMIQELRKSLTSLEGLVAKQAAQIEDLKKRDEKQREQLREQKMMIRNLENTALVFRAKRKVDHILGNNVDKYI